GAASVGGGRSDSGPPPPRRSHRRSHPPRRENSREGARTGAQTGSAPERRSAVRPIRISTRTTAGVRTPSRPRPASSRLPAAPTAVAPADGDISRNGSSSCPPKPRSEAKGLNPKVEYPKIGCREEGE